jgi:hypothetical protein
MQQFSLDALALSSALVMSGCGSSVATYNPATHRYETSRVRGGMWGIFTHVVDAEVAREASGEKLTSPWEKYWEGRCQTLYYDVKWGDKGIKYIIDKRRSAGLPDIPKIESRDFKSKWEIFVEGVDFQIDKEVRGFPHPQPGFKSWSDYWLWASAKALSDPTISHRGVEYVRQRRVEAGLAPRLGANGNAR